MDHATTHSGMRHVLQTMAIVVTRGLRARAWIGHDGRMKIKGKSGERETVRRSNTRPKKSQRKQKRGIRKQVSAITDQEGLMEKKNQVRIVNHHRINYRKCRTKLERISEESKWRRKKMKPLGQKEKIPLAKDRYETGEVGR